MPNSLKTEDAKAVNIGVAKNDRASVAQALAACLASTEMLFMKTQYYHWNVTGTSFYGLHNLFEQQYNALKEGGDEIAERIRALGHMAPGTFQEFQPISVVEEDKSLPTSWQQMVENLMNGHEACTQGARKAFEQAEEVDDVVSADLLVDKMKFHEKSAWMLRSFIEGDALASSDNNGSRPTSDKAKN